MKKLERELERLSYQFRKERITVKEYDKDDEDLVKRINDARARQAAIENPVQKDFSALRKLLETDIGQSLQNLYSRRKTYFLVCNHRQNNDLS